VVLQKYVHGWCMRNMMRQPRAWLDSFFGLQNFGENGWPFLMFFICFSLLWLETCHVADMPSRVSTASCSLQNRHNRSKLPSWNPPFINFPSYKPLFSAGISQPHLTTSSSCSFENQPPKLSPRSEVFDYPTIRDMTGFVLTALPDAWRRRLRRLRACQQHGDPVGLTWLGYIKKHLQ
jgi:hypothetical protein